MTSTKSSTLRRPGFQLTVTAALHWNTLSHELEQNNYIIDLTSYVM